MLIDKLNYTIPSIGNIPKPQVKEEEVIEETAEVQEGITVIPEVPAEETSMPDEFEFSLTGDEAEILEDADCGTFDDEPAPELPEKIKMAMEVIREALKGKPNISSVGIERFDMGDKTEYDFVKNGAIMFHSTNPDYFYKRALKWVKQYENGEV